MGQTTKTKFELFTLGPRVSTGVPRVTVGRQGVLVFNKKFLDEFGKLVQGRNMAFLFDAENQLIGLKVVNTKATYTRPIRTLKDNNGNLKGLQVSARAFFIHYKIPYDKSYSLPIVAQKAEDDPKAIAFFVVDLKAREDKEKGEQ
jgi:hypothetical protein